MGGIGFRDLYLLNLAFLGRYVWILLNYRDTLCYQVMSSKYFSNGDLFHPKAVEKPCYTWVSMNATAIALNDGFGWQVGNGKSVNIRRHNWGFEGLIGDTLKPNCLTLHERKVTDLWSIDQQSWNKERDVMRVLDRKATADFFTTVWNSWNNRNNHIFRDKEDKAKEKPPYGFMKVNFYATVTPNRTGYGMIVNDKDGFVIGGGGGFKEEALTVDWA
ncbi:hypothetical protein Gohar_020476 [Gossypium harknessii]|uniref:Uncharacterized protein n=1 Tax=Gossypium harknessii TaxID=34285 RepID=A0A7J9HZ65_9ROSI|nr:hypothetical protein [Gossypium harknessii]